MVQTMSLSGLAGVYRPRFTAWALSASRRAGCPPAPGWGRGKRQHAARTGSKPPPFTVRGDPSSHRFRGTLCFVFRMGLLRVCFGVMETKAYFGWPPMLVRGKPCRERHYVLPRLLRLGFSLSGLGGAEVEWPRACCAGRLSATGS